TRVLADVSRRAEARFERRARRAEHHVGAVLEERARQREEVVVADQRVALEPDVALIALARDAERRAVTADAQADETSRGPERALGVRVEHDGTVGVRIRGGERVGL